MRTWKNALKKKLTLSPDKKFDQEFWTKFDQEFKVSKKKLFFGFDYRVWTAAMLVLMVSVPLYISRTEKNTLDPQVAQLIENQEFLNDFEMIETLDEDLMLASNEEWGALLE